MTVKLPSGETRLVFPEGFATIGQVGNVNISLKSRYYPTDTQTTKGPFYLSTSTQRFNPRTRGRQVAVRVESNGYDGVNNDATSENWRLGTLRFEVQPDGMR